MTQDDSKGFELLRLQTEALLFSFGDWLSIKDIAHTLMVDSEMMVKNALGELEQKYKEGFSFTIEKNDDNKYRMALKSDFSDLVSDLISGTEIPQNVLRVLSVIAYEQPVTKTRLSEILGKSVKTEVEYLYRNKFLSYEKNGIGKYYKVTKKFYDYFKLDEDEDFRDQANKSIQTFLEDIPNLEENTENLDEKNDDIPLKKED